MKKRRLTPSTTTSSSNMDAMASLTTLQAMKRQEETFYKEPFSEEDYDLPVETLQVMEDAMSAMAAIFDLCRLQHRDTLVYAMSYLCHSFPQLSQDPMNLPLTALVCFYLAVKLHEPAAIPLKSLPHLYQRFFVNVGSGDVRSVSEADALQCELKICKALQWRLHAPMATQFVMQLLLPRRYHQEEEEALVLLERAFEQDPISFVRRYRPSTLALAAVYLTNEEEERGGYDDDDCPQLLAENDTLLMQDPYLGSAMHFLGSVMAVMLITPWERKDNKKSNKKRRCVSPRDSDEASSPQRKKQRRFSNDTDTKTMIQCSSFCNISPRSALVVTSDSTT